MKQEIHFSAGSLDVPIKPAAFCGASLKAGIHVVVPHDDERLCAECLTKQTTGRVAQPVMVQR